MGKAFKIAQSTLETLTTSGSVTLGDASGDALTINSSAVSIPNGLNFDSNTLVIDAANNRIAVNGSDSSVGGGQMVVNQANNNGLVINQTGSGNGASIYLRNATDTTINNFNFTNSGVRFFDVGTNSERMRIDSSGNVLVGTTTSTAYSNYVNNTVFRTVSSVSDSSTSSGSNIGQLAIDNIDTTTNNYSKLAFTTSDGSNRVVASGIYTQVTARTSGNFVSSNMQFWTGTTGAPPAERMRIDSSGNVGIGTSSPDTKLYVASGRTTLSANNEQYALQLNYGTTKNGPFLGSPSADTFVVSSSGGTERMRIDSSGGVLIGTTSNAGNVNLVIGGGSARARVLPATDNAGYIGESTYRWQAIYAVNGTIQTSDGREKNSIIDSDLGLDFISALRPVSYKWNVGENVVTYDEEENEVVTPRAGVRTHYGLIAQEVKAAIPEGVDFGGFIQEPNDGMMSLRYHEFIAPLIKAIQELKAEFDAYKATHP